MKCDDPVIKELNEKTVAYVRFVGNYMGNPKVFEDLFGRICSWAGPKGLLGRDVKFISAYYDDPNVTPPEKMTLDVCLEISSDVEVGGDIKKQALPGGKYVVMNSELAGPEEYGPAWMKVVNWMKENNYEIDGSRASYELYLNDPKSHPKGHHIMNICMPTK